MKNSPQAVIGLVFSRNRQEILLIKRRDVPIWSLPGGGVEEGEPPEEAILREIFEETGIRASITRKIGSYTPVRPFSLFTEVFECMPLDGEPTTGPETKEVDFFPLASLPAPFIPIHQHWIDDALAMQETPFYKPVQGVSWPLFFKYCITHPHLIARYLLAKAGFPLNTQ